MSLDAKISCIAPATNRTSVSDADAWLRGLIPPRIPIEIPLAHACGRILSQEIRSPLAVPNHRRSAMDGFAIRADDVVSLPIELAVVGRSRPGREPTARVESGQAVEIATGGPLPEGADTVVPIEQATRNGERVTIRECGPKGKHVITVGEDVPEGAKVFGAGRCLRPQDVAMLSSLGIARISVIALPKVGIITTGDELQEPGTSAEGYGIIDSNSVMLPLLVNRDGGEVRFQRRLPDEPSLLRAAVSEAATVCDLLIMVGGTSVGEEDHSARTIQSLGHLAIHGLAARPGAPTGMGQVGACAVLLLPGNPTACLMMYYAFAAKTILRFGGRPEMPYRHASLRLAEPLISVKGRTDFVRVRITEAGVHPGGIGGASRLSSVTQADGFVVVDEAVERIDAGECVMVNLYG